MYFDWDATKAARNLAKHGVSFEEAASVFEDPLAYIFIDPDHSQAEQRFLTFGANEALRGLIEVAQRAVKE